MAYMVFEVNVPAATPEATPVVIEKEVIAGFLKRATIIIPNGHQGLARLRMETLDRMIIPSPGSDPAYIRGDGNTLEVETNLKLEGPRWLLRFIGWNADAVFDHAFIVHLHLTNGQEQII